MKETYDFSQGQRGKFYHPNAEFELPDDSPEDESDESILVGLQRSLQELSDGKSIPLTNLWENIDAESPPS
jgi:hypothetical protein